MNEKYDNDDDLYNLIGDGGGDDDHSDRSMILRDGIDLNQLIIDNNERNQINIDVNVTEAARAEKSAYSKLINARAETNLGLYLGRRESLIGGGDLREVLCGECGERNVGGVDWCLFCGVLLLGGVRENILESCEAKREENDEKDSFEGENYEKNENKLVNNDRAVIKVEREKIRESCVAKRGGNNEKESFAGENNEKDEDKLVENDREVIQVERKSYLSGVNAVGEYDIVNRGVKWRNITVEEIKIEDDEREERECCENRVRNGGIKVRENSTEERRGNCGERLNGTIEKKINPFIEDCFKLDLNEVETRRSEDGGEWDFEIEDNSGCGKVVSNININSHVNVVPRLDLSSVHSCRDVENVVRVTEDSKENKEKISRKWTSSSTAWNNMPPSILNKKPSTYCRNKLNSCTNNIGVTINQSGVLVEDVLKIVNSDIKFQSASLPSDINCNNKNKDDCMTREDVVRSKVDYKDITYAPPVIINIKCANNFDVSLWQCLPAEIWIKIMMNLNHHELSLLQQTCRRIYSIALHASLWKSINLYRHSTLTNDHIFYIARKKPYELHFKNCFGTYITGEGLKVMFNICGEGLKKISFISCSKGAFEDDLFLVLSASYCPNVTHINASYLMNLHDETLKTMIKGFTKIESLNIMGAHSISNKSIKSLTEHHRASLINLDLYGCFKLNSLTLTLLEGCLNLRSLALGSISNLKRTALIGMLRKLSQLIILDLRGTMNLVDDFLLQQICQSCPNLQQIILTNSCRLTDDGLIGLAKSCVSKSLNILDICGCSKITEKGLEEVLKCCHQLEDLDISCTGIKGDGAKYFKIYTPPNLRCLRINNNRFISKDELVSLVGACKRLTTLYMCGSTSIGSWRYMEERFPRVTFKHE